MKDYINKEYIRIMVKQIRRSSKNNHFYITKKDERDIILITLKVPREERKLDITEAVKDYFQGNCNQKELAEYIWNRYKTWKYKNIPTDIENKKRIGLKKKVAEEYPDYEKMLENIGITWTGFKARIGRGMNFYEALTTPKIAPSWERARRAKGKVE